MAQHAGSLMALGKYKIKQLVAILLLQFLFCCGVCRADAWLVPRNAVNFGLDLALLESLHKQAKPNKFKKRTPKKVHRHDLRVRCSHLTKYQSVTFAYGLKDNLEIGLNASQSFHKNSFGRSIASNIGAYTKIRIKQSDKICISATANMHTNNCGIRFMSGFSKFNKKGVKLVNEYGIGLMTKYRDSIYMTAFTSLLLEYKNFGICTRLDEVASNNSKLRLKTWEYGAHVKWDAFFIKLAYLIKQEGAIDYGMFALSLSVM